MQESLEEASALLLKASCPSSHLRSYCLGVGVVPMHWRLDMKPWKAALGVGAACAACCAVPLLGGAAALTIGSASLGAAGAALLVRADEFAPLAWVLLGLAAMGTGVVLWRRTRQRRTYCVPGECR